LVSYWLWFAVEAQSAHIDDAVEAALQAQCVQDSPGMGRIGVSENKFSLADAQDQLVQFGIRLDHILDGQVVDEGQKIVGVDMEVSLQATQCGPIGFEIETPQRRDLIGWQA